MKIVSGGTGIWSDQVAKFILVDGLKVFEIRHNKGSDTFEITAGSSYPTEL